MILFGRRMCKLGGLFVVTLLHPLLVHGQTDAYMIEAISERERPTGDEETFTMGRPDFRTRGPALQRDEFRIGTARAATRGPQRGGRSGPDAGTMLRFDQHREIEPPTEATLRIGPWYTDLGIALRGGVTYSRFRKRGIDFPDGTRRGEVREDGLEYPLSATLILNNYMILTRRMDLSLNLRMSYFHYPRGTQEDEFAVSLTEEGISATFSTQFHPTRYSRIFVYDDILFLTDYVDRRGISDRLAGREYRLLQNTVGADWDWRASPRDAFSASISREDTLPQGQAFRIERRVVYREMASYRRQFRPYAAGGILGQASQSLAQIEERPDTYIHGYSFFLGLNMTENMVLHTSVGQQFGVVKGGTIPETRRRQTTFGTASLDHNLGRGRWQRFSFQRSLAESFGGGIERTDQFTYWYRWHGDDRLFPGWFTSQYLIVDPLEPPRDGYRDWVNRIHVRTWLTRVIPLRLTASYAMRFNEAGTAGVIDDDPELRDDYQTLRLRASTRFRVYRRITFDAYAQHTQRTSDNAELEYKQDSVGAHLTWYHRF